MIKSITVTNHLGESIKLELEFPEKSGFSVLDVKGLGPPKADINTTDLATNDGSRFNSSRVTPRNVVIELGFLFDPTVEVVRQRSYKYFPIKKMVSLLVETDERLCETYGYVESNEPNMFSDQEGTQISIICPDPYLYSAGPDGRNVAVFFANSPVFEFEFSNESLTQNLIEFGQIIVEPNQTIYYEGDADVGITIVMHAVGAVTNVSIYNTQTHETMRFDTDKLVTLTGAGLGAGDTVTISTIKGNKYVSLLRDGNYINVLNCIGKDPDWFQLTKGDNIFAYEAESGFNNLEFRIENVKVYEGV